MSEARPEYDIHDLPNWLRTIERELDGLEKRVAAVEKGAPASGSAAGGGDVVVKVVGKSANAALERSVDDLRAQVALLKDRPGGQPDPALASSLRALEERTRRLEGLEQQVAKLEQKIKPGQAAPPGAAPVPSAPGAAGAVDAALRAELDVLRRELKALSLRPPGSPAVISAGPSSSAMAELESRLQRVETRKVAPTMTVRGKEIPLEISGIVAGLIVISIGAIVLITGKSFSPIEHPAFVVGAGALVIGAGVMKAILLSNQNAAAPPKPKLGKR